MPRYHEVCIGLAQETIALRLVDNIALFLYCVVLESMAQQLE
jgi:hypothetical protein